MQKITPEHGGKREQIIAAARKMFFEKGFDGVTIRAVQREVGCEVGLFYYYFKSKDEVFEVIFDQLEEEWAKGFEKAAKNAEADPTDAARKIFEHIQKCGNALTKESGGKMHWSVEKAAYSRIAKAAEPFVRDIIKAMKNFGAVNSGLSPETLAMVAAAGIGRLVLSEGKSSKELLMQGLSAFELLLSASDMRTKVREEKSARREISVELL